MDFKKTLEAFSESSRFKEGLDFIIKHTSDESLTIDERSTLTLFKIRFLEKLEKYSESFEIIETALTEASITQNLVFETDLQIERTKVLFSTGKMDEVVETIKSTERKLLQLTHLSDQELSAKMADLVLLRGGYYWQNGELRNALFYFKFNLELRKKIRKPLDIANAYNNVGVLYNAQGDLLKALKYLKEAFGMYKKINSLRGISKTGNNIGAILIQLGQLNEALLYMTKSLEIDISCDYSDGIRVSSHNIGEVYWHKGNYYEAFAHLMNGLLYCQKLNDPFQISDILVPIIAVLIEMKEYIKAMEYFNRLKDIDEKSQNKIIHQRFLLTQAWIAMLTPTPSYILVAEHNLKLIVEDEIRYYDVTVMAHVSLCEVLLLRIEKENNIQYLNEISQILAKLIGMSKKTNSVAIIVEALLVQAKIALYNLNFWDAQLFLNQAQQYCQKNELYRKEQIVFQEFDELMQNLSFWEKQDEFDEVSHKQEQLQLINFQLQKIFSPTENTTLDTKGIDHPVFISISHPDGTEITTKIFQEQLDPSSLSYSIFQLNLTKKYTDFLEFHIELARLDENKVLFRKVGHLIITYIYHGSSFEAYKRMNTLDSKISENLKLQTPISPNTHQYDENGYTGFFFQEIFDKIFA